MTLLEHTGGSRHILRKKSSINPPSGAAGTYTIGFAMTLDHPYWQNMRLGAIDQAAKLGARVTIMNANEDPVLQIQQIQVIDSKAPEIELTISPEEGPYWVGQRIVQAFAQYTAFFTPDLF